VAALLKRKVAPCEEARQCSYMFLSNKQEEEKSMKIIWHKLQHSGAAAKKDQKKKLMAESAASLRSIFFSNYASNVAAGEGFLPG
jgi:hypothetical protein